MDKINSLIALLSPIEQQLFIANLKKYNKRQDTKNISLFQLYQKGEPEKLKSQMGANSYGVLKKRLSDRLEEFTANSIIIREQTAEVEIMKDIILSRKLLERKNYKLGLKLLLKTEKKALAINHFHLLNEIYQTLITYSYHQLSADQQSLFEKAEKNRIAYENQRNLTMAYAVIRRSFYEQERNFKPIDIAKITQENFQKFGINDELGYNFQSLYQIAEMADITGSVGKNYSKIDLFFEEKVALLQGGPLDTENQLIYHIDLLYLIAHIYFRKKDFKKSFIYLEKMREEMSRYAGLYYPLRETKYKTLLALNNNYTGNHTVASETLDELLSKKGHFNSKENEVLQATLSRIMIHFQQGELQLAKRKMAAFRHRDKHYIDSVGLEWLLNKKFMEVLLHIELGNTDLVDSLIASLTRKQRDYFSEANQQGFRFLQIIQQYHQKPQEINSEKFKEKIENSFDWKPIEQEDLFFISFYAWLKSKMSNTPLYKTTLSLLNTSTPKK